MSQEPFDAATSTGAVTMADNDKGSVGKKLLHGVLGFPLTFILIAAAVMMEVMALKGPLINYIMIIFAIVFLVLETIKVTRVDKGKFLLEVIVATAGVAIATALLTYRLSLEGTAPALYHWVVFAVLCYDATVTPYLAYSNALRDMNVAGGHD